tara:strand:+ start:5188 stop:5577 length:390 start_codon:yes stop_codon:yes gene_type:complete
MRLQDFATRYEMVTEIGKAVIEKNVTGFWHVSIHNAHNSLYIEKNKDSDNSYSFVNVNKMSNYKNEYLDKRFGFETAELALAFLEEVTKIKKPFINKAMTKGMLFREIAEIEFTDLSDRKDIKKWTNIK